MFKDLPGQCGQHGILGEVSAREGKKEIQIRQCLIAY